MIDSYSDWPPEKKDNGGDWSEAKLKILHLLWPGDWINGTVILREVDQPYYDRRIRELRENGWDIKTHSSRTKYRLLSHKKSKGSVRKYPSAKLKRQVLIRDQETCQICGESINLQYDHKIPHEKGGSTNLENLQILCSACNVEKRGACKRCDLSTCEDCPYAYPEIIAHRILLKLDNIQFENLSDLAEKAGIPIGSYIERELSEIWNKNK